MALAIELLVVGRLALAIGSWRDAGGDAAAGKEHGETSRCRSQQFLGLINREKKQRYALVVALCPSIRSMTIGRPWLSQTVCSFEFSPPLVRPRAQFQPHLVKLAPDSAFSTRRGAGSNCGP